jgi:DNA-binding PadR family transcriptional regulator
MSPVFRHGRLRLYLLKLLDESPRHGYEVIRLLQDRFLGVYAPSPGTIYPRLARLEEEGLVTHDVTDGKKVYRITEKGREELRGRIDDLNELEEEITASVRDIAREVSEDVRETVRSLREELTWAAREIRSRAHQSAGAAQPWAEAERDGPHGEPPEQDIDRDESGAEGAAAPRGEREEHGHGEWCRHGGEHHGGEQHSGEHHGGEQHSGEHHGGRHGGDKEWGDWATWAGWGNWGGPGAHHHPDPRVFRDFERLAKQFSRDLRSAAWHAQAVSEDAVRDLRGILEETIDRIKSEVFRATAPPPPPGKPAPKPPDPGAPAPESPASADPAPPAE